MENAASLATGPDGRKRRVSYFFEPEFGQPREPYAYASHIANSLIFKHGLHRHMEIYRPILAGVSDFLRFHSRDYIDFLASVTPMTLNDPSFLLNVRRSRFFSNDVYMDREMNLFDYCRAYAGCSLTAAAKMNRREADIAINWSGGMHRAKSDKATEFCFVNDIVLAILELLKTFILSRVLYIDIGYHRGDGVEEAFYDTDRVMTVSFHTDSDSFTSFPRYGYGYGDRRELYSLNAPLKDCLKDKSLGNLFRPVITKATEVYQPEVVVLQCGADSLADNWPGRFNLKIKGHGDCLQFVRSFNVPLMVLGGGGSEPRFVSRCWCYETAVAVGVGEQLENDLKVNEFFYKPNFKQDLNTPRDIEILRNGLLRKLSQLIHVPSVQFQDTPSMSQATEPAEVDMEKRQVLSNLRRSKL
ncbi:PREDICTED: histone deacetylase 7-like [Camelina sativa]|uniref:Histone deacetylase n=1 Tax=Camelina sativa TaxID=90675 RepID=A0ABM0YX94_CAMSA|nr:PREDICTED: histone deacetylase 7-like [Camelina sativa]